MDEDEIYGTLRLSLLYKFDGFQKLSYIYILEMKTVKIILFFFIFLALSQVIFAAPPPPPGGMPGCWPPPCVPIDGGITLLIAAGAAYGAKKLYNSRKKSPKIS